MSKIEFYMRPLVAFDATKSEHRAYYYQFLEKRGWGWCPYRFIVPDGTNSNLITEIQQKMLDYYVRKEFEAGARIRSKPVVEKQQKTVAQKKTKTVDKKAN